MYGRCFGYGKAAVRMIDGCLDLQGKVGQLQDNLEWE